MTKWTNGVLCRDARPVGLIVFFPGDKLSDPYILKHLMFKSWAGFWYSPRGWRDWEWTLKEWNETYPDLQPPRKGKKFEAQVQL